MLLKMDYIRVEIDNLSLVPSGGGACAIMLREADGQRVLPVLIGLMEAQAIAVRLNKMSMPRPLTHDLTQGIMAELKAKVVRVSVDKVRDGTFYATMEVVHASGAFKIDARPSDAIAMAVRFDAPIFVASSVMNRAAASPEELPSQEMEVSDEGLDVSDAPADSPEQVRSPLESLEEEMKSAIVEEDYEKAARIRDEIRRLRDQQ